MKEVTIRLMYRLVKNWLFILLSFAINQCIFSDCFYFSTLLFNIWYQIKCIWEEIRGGHCTDEHAKDLKLWKNLVPVGLWNLSFCHEIPWTVNLPLLGLAEEEATASKMNSKLILTQLFILKIKNMRWVQKISYLQMIMSLSK